MPPKNTDTRTKDIRSFFKEKSDNPGSSSLASPESTQPGGATASQTFNSRLRVKEENDGDSMGGHLHRFTVKFGRNNIKEYTVDCHQPCTVLEAIKSKETYKKLIKCADKNIVIQLDKKDKHSAVATHFPCSCVRDGETLIIIRNSKKIEEAGEQYHQIVHSGEQYSVFYIDTVGGLHTRTKQLFRNPAVKQFKYLCVYGEKGMTVREALKRDGRFIDLDNFLLSDNANSDVLTDCAGLVDNLDQKAFKICLQQNKREDCEKQQENPGASNNLQHRDETRPVSDVIQQSGISVKKALEKKDSNNTEEIYEKLREQFPNLRKLMESRFSGDSYQKELTLRKENFGKIQQSFCEVHRVRKLLKLGESVCKIIVENVCVGTGFVLFDNFILTNAHLFNSCVQGEQVQKDINVFAVFDYDDPQPQTNYYLFSCKKELIDFDVDLDYAILELRLEGQTHNKKRKQKIKVPPGLLEKLGPMPEDGEACIIGHPAGGVKKMDPTCIIDTKMRESAVSAHLHRYKDTLVTLQSIREVLGCKGLENIMQSKEIMTYKTFMYHGSSGSPVFDAHCRVIGLHSAGFDYGFPGHKEHVIEFARPLLTIFKKFVSNLDAKGDERLLQVIAEIEKTNEHLKRAEPDEPMDIS